ncbi:MAG: tetratricopeptide repeat protein [Spirosomataceae bacterium]
MIESLLISLLLWIWDNRSFDTISRSNRAKTEGQEAYLEKDYSKALTAYRNISNASLFAEAEARLNLAHTYFQLKQLQNARRYYTRLAKVHNNPMLSSRACNQLGIIETLDKDTVSALRYFKESLRHNPDNQKARYNYELLKKSFSGKEETAKSKPTPQKSEQSPSPVPPPKTSREVQKTEEKKQLLTQLQNMNMSEAQAMMILDALKASEIQYLQQQKHRSTSSNDVSKGKW